MINKTKLIKSLYPMISIKNFNNFFCSITPKHNKLPLTIFGLTFTFDGIRYTLQEQQQSITPSELLKISQVILKEYDKVNLKGFVPLVFDSNLLGQAIKRHLHSVGYTIDTVGGDNNSYQLWYNFIIVNLLCLVTEEWLILKPVCFDEVSLELLSELENLRSNLTARLDPYLRIQIQQRGLSVIQNTYTGFDTEYELFDQKNHLNKLLSVQIAAQTRTLVKIPLYNTYDISYVHPLTSEVTTNYKPSVNVWNTFQEEEESNEKIKVNEKALINESLKTCIIRMRSRFTTLDYLNHNIVEKLKGVEGVKYFEDLKRDQIIFALPTTNLKTKIIYPDKGISFKSLVKMSNKEVEPALSESFVFLLTVLKDQGFDNNTLLKWYNTKTNKPRSRTSVSLDTGDKISFSVVKNNYMCAHYSTADLCLMDDFEDFKKDLNIINKSFTTIGKPLKFESSFVFIRDTILLAPAGNRSLEALGGLYQTEGNFSKKTVSKEDLMQMSKFIERDKKGFERYAIQDAIITLKHALSMEEFNFNLKQLGVPLTLSSMGRNFVLEEWRKTYEKYFPYQITGEFLMGNSDEMQTPKGLFVSGDVGLHMSYYIGNYKGGRNESFMYGTENETKWFDYDLVSAYTTAMSHLSLPDYSGGGLLLDHDSVESLSTEELLRGYLIVNGTFTFPNCVKYPSIPCYIDSTTTLYPQNGNCLLTGPEYLLAKNQGGKIKIKSAYYIPPTEITRRVGKVEITTSVKPFASIIKEIQAKRKEHQKGTVLNLLYKEMGNSIYGNVVRGMSNKKSFDTKTGKMFRVGATEISNPILASWTTAFIRSVIGECLHNIHKVGGKVVSVTTDGFITDIPDLESKLMELKTSDTPLLSMFRNLRTELSDNSECLELKHSGIGIVSWNTRGQLGIESGIKATTGFQSLGYEKQELVKLFKQTLKSDEKQFEYTNSRLRSAKDIFNFGGHVTRIMKDQKFRLFFDNRRQIQEPDGFKGHDMSVNLFDSSPLKNYSDCKTMRFLSKLTHNLPYNKNTTRGESSLYKTYIEVGVRNFLKGYLAKEPCFGLQGTEFKRVNDLISFIYGFTSTKGVKLSHSSISNLKHRKIIIKPVPNTPENKAFSHYIKQHLPQFNENEFLKSIH